MCFMAEIQIYHSGYGGSDEATYDWPLARTGWIKTFFTAARSDSDALSSMRVDCSKYATAPSFSSCFAFFWERLAITGIAAVARIIGQSFTGYVKRHRTRKITVKLALASARSTATRKNLLSSTTSIFTAQPPGMGAGLSMRLSFADRM
jgi:hypothetical protein